MTVDSFGRLKFLKDAPPLRYKLSNGRVSVHRRCQFKCSCGKKTVQILGQVKAGKIVSCGCYRNEQNRTANLSHGLSKHRVMVIWNNMIARCTRPSAIQFHNYGGRGIQVCRRWLKFQNFVDDMGLPPEGHGIDRKNPNKNYTKSNCKWSPLTDCSNGTRLALKRRVTFKGESISIARLARREGVPYTTLYHRIRVLKMKPEMAASKQRPRQ